MGKGLHKVFKTVVKHIFARIANFGRIWFRSFPFHPEPRNFAEVTKLSDEINKTWLKATLKEIKNLVNNQNFIVDDPEKDEPVTPCMDVYKANIQYD